MSAQLACAVSFQIDEYVLGFPKVFNDSNRCLASSMHRANQPAKLGAGGEGSVMGRKASEEFDVQLIDHCTAAMLFLLGDHDEHKTHPSDG